METTKKEIGKSFITNYVVSNPNCIKDVKSFLRLTIAETEIQKQIDVIDNKHILSQPQKDAGDLTFKERLNVLIDRIEFIEHLNLVSGHIKSSKFKISEQEVVGLDWDIMSLRIYLALTCWDIFCVDKNHKKRFENILSNTSDALKSRLSANIRLVDENNNKLIELKKIAEHLYDIRNDYTHKAKRFHIMPQIPIEQIQGSKSGIQKNKTTKYMSINGGFDFVEFILEVAIYDTKKIFNWS
jgi:hypothetical protein